MIDKRETASITDLVISNMYSIEAIVRVLVEKGICTQEEILEALKGVRAEEGGTTPADSDSGSRG